MNNLATINNDDFSNPPSSFYDNERQKVIRTTQSRYALYDDIVSWQANVLDRFFYLTTLPENWDSYNSKKISKHIALAAYALLMSVVKAKTPMPNIIPTKNGGINIEWHENNIDLEIEFISLAQISVYFEKLNDDEEPEEIMLTDNMEPLVSFIEAITN